MLLLLTALLLVPGAVPPRAVVAVPSPPAAQTGHPRLSPFEMVRWAGSEPEVSVRGAWWRLESIDGVPARTILADARRFFGADWPKRFCEDLVEILARAGHAPGASSVLVLREPGGSELTTLRDVAWTAENRARIRDARPRPAAAPAGRGADAIAWVERVERERATAVPAALEPLARRLDALEALPGRLTRAEAAADLAQLEWLVDNVFAYRDRTGFDRRAAFDALHARLPESIARASFALQVHRLLCGFGDGHTRVREPAAELFVPGALPFRVARDARGVVALAADGTALDAQHPWLAAIDGEPLAVWLDAARALVPRGSPAFEERAATNRVVHVAHLRAERGLPASVTARVALEGRDGARVEREVALAPRPLRAPDGDLLAGRRLAGDVAYLRIGRMDDDPEFLARLDRLLDESSGARGLVIDVRGNGGGSRLPLLRVAPRLVPRGTDAVVVNVAALRVAPGEDARTAGDALADRFLYPADWPGWSDAARAAVERAASAFAPRATLVAGEFTRWHFLVLERDAARPPLTTGRVAVLVDEGCFSATDVFLGALAELSNVTLVGAPSGGGSGRARAHELAHSRLGVQLSTMASFRPDGAPYDGLGVEPDVRVEPALDDVLGRTDTTLERALELVRPR